MFLGSYTYSGQPAALLAGYRRLLDRFRDGSLAPHLAATTPTGLVVIDACPSAEEFGRFSTGPEFRAQTVAAGLPLPQIHPLGPVVHAVLRAPVPLAVPR